MRRNKLWRGLSLQECSLQSCTKVPQSQSPCQWLGKRRASIGCAVQCVIGSATLLQQNVICWVNLGGRCSTPSIAIGHLHKHVLKCTLSLAARALCNTRTPAPGQAPSLSPSAAKADQTLLCTTTGTVKALCSVLAFPAKGEQGVF